MRRTSLGVLRSSIEAKRSSLSQPEDQIETLEELIQILSKPSPQRSVKSLTYLLSLALKLRFFKQLAQDLSEEAVSQCCLHMTHEAVKKGEVVFLQGELGSKFYVVLEGRVVVFIRSAEALASNDVAILGKGDCFGELALLSNKPRAAGIRCIADCHFAVLDKADYTRILAKVHEQKMAEKVEFLQTLPMFRKWTRGSMQKLSFYFQERLFTRKQSLAKAGSPASEVLFIWKGEVQVSQEVQVKTQSGALRSPRTQTATTELAILGTGESIGHGEVISGSPHAFTYMCYSATLRTLVISAEDFLKRVNTEESWNFLKTVTEIKGDMRRQRISSLRSLEELKAQAVAPSLPVSPSLKQQVYIEPEPAIRLYPFKRDFRESAPLARPTAIKSFRRLKSWDRILSRKVSPKEHKPVKAIPNIHTRHQRTAHLSIGDGNWLKRSLTQAFTPPRSSYLSASPPCLTINTVEVVTAERDSSHLSPKLDRIVSSRHSQFRVRHFSNQEDGTSGKL